MSDSRCHIVISFDIYGQHFAYDGSINYFDSGDGCDERIKAFFASSYAAAYEEFSAANAEADRRVRAAQIEADELKMLAALQAKYPTAARA